MGVFTINRNQGLIVNTPGRKGNGVSNVAIKEILPRGPQQAWPIHLLARVVDWLLVLAAAVMIVLVFFNVCAHAAGHDIAATTEACELMMVWVSFLGGASIIRRAGHMTITEFIDKLGERPRRYADFIVQLFALGVLWILLRNGLIIIDNNWGNILTVLGIPMSVQYMPLSIASGIGMVFVLYDLYQILCGISREERYGADE
ncbi:TRAP-type C4-dicarboxylate transport system, small permease component [Propionivibrio dicarboxylicus]|uniref:TRAP transporter small permease protein n=1 Tax=Propionivibrio dicarboxylicus TaxID=83767 RepID=A0A1G8KLR9_9RHOO|nr:TRAP-type C4-dicarboxylate transport system, small permease component [Propionivibrio dicarboxylicus]